MFGFLIGFGLEIATIVASNIIGLIVGENTLSKISKNGYKVDMVTLDNCILKMSDKTPNNERLVSLILSIIPGVNMIHRLIEGIKERHEIMNALCIKEALIPMTDKEKEEYSQTKKWSQKLSFSIFTPLRYQALPGTYTLDEVKKLNATILDSYTIGTINNIPVAIIGISKYSDSINRIKFLNDNETYEFKKLTEEEAQNMMFTVYPFLSEVLDNKKLQKCLEEITKIQSNKAKISEDYNKETSMESVHFTPEEISTVGFPEKEKIPCLKKTPSFKNRKCD